MAEDKDTTKAAATEQPAVQIGGLPEAKLPENQPLTAPPLPPGVLFVWGTGRRKKAVARVRIRPGSGKFVINERDKDVFFTSIRDQMAAILPLTTANMMTAWDIYANVNGGGPTGQAGAVALGLSRALIKAAPDTEAALRGQGLLTRDARMKERKKYGQRGARRRFQFSKR